MPNLVRVKIVRLIDPATGRRVPAGTPGAVTKTVNSRKWYGKNLPGQPPSKRVPLASDKSVAQRMLNDIVRGAERGAAGMPDADAGRLSLSALLVEFESDMLLGLASKKRATSKKPSAAQVSLTVQRIRDIIAGCKFTAVGSLNAAAPAKLARYINGRVALARKDGGFSAQSAEFYRKAAKRFAWWLSARRRCPVRAELFDDVPSHDAKANRVHPRRVIEAVELASLLTTTRASKRRYRGLRGIDRYTIYLVAITTGFRAAELDSLDQPAFLLDANPSPIVQLRAEHSKNGKEARQPLPVGVAAHLREYLPSRPADRIWPGTWAEKPAKMLKGDLKEAGIKYAVDGGTGKKYLDFHALRHSFVSLLAAAGVSPKELQVLARHSDPTITLGIYTHASAGSLGGAVERIALPAAAGGERTLASMTREELEAGILSLAFVVRTLLGG